MASSPSPSDSITEKPSLAVAGARSPQTPHSMGFSDEGTYAGDHHGQQFSNINSLNARKTQYDGGLPGPGGNLNGNATPGTPGTPGIVRERRFYARYPNLWVRARHTFREPAAEFLGTMILVMFGTAGNAQGTLFNNPNVSTSQAGGYLSVAVGWGAGFALGAWVSGGISGGHVNPAVTIALATFRSFPWRLVPFYILAQLLGAIVGAAITYAVYVHAIDLAEGGSGVRTVPGTAKIFGTYAVSYLGNAGAFFDEFIGTFLLVIVLLAVTDKRNGSPPAGLLPIALFFTLFGIGMTFGAQTGFAVNPARDLGPRILTAMVGYGREVFDFRHQYWIWCPIIAPICGALVATFVYDCFLFGDVDSLLTRPSKKARAVGVKEYAPNVKDPAEIPSQV